jgi:hypothetical protein
MKQGRQRLSGGYTFHAMAAVTAIVQAYRIGGLLSIKKNVAGLTQHPMYRKWVRIRMGPACFLSGLSSLFWRFYVAAADDRCSLKKIALFGMKA